MKNWGKKYSKFLNLSQFNEELITPLKSKDLKRFLSKMAEELPDTEEIVPAYNIKNITFSNIVNFLKEYYILLVSIPLVIGGILQLKSLNHVGSNYLRFFSSTQLLTDGIIFILFIFVFLMFVGFFATLGYILLKDKRLATIISIYIFILFAIYFFENWEFIIKGVIDFNLKTLLLFFGIFICINLLVWTKKKWVRIPSYTIGLIFTIWLLALFIFTALKSFNYNFTLGDVDNNKNLICVLEREQIEYDEFQVVYYNDKFIFIETTIDTIKKIRILPFNSLFEGMPCADSN